MTTKAPAADILWLDQATQLCARIQCSESGDEFAVAKAIVGCLETYANGSSQPLDFAPDLTVTPERANEAICIAVIRSIRDRASYLISRNIMGEAIATIVHEDFGDEVTFVGKSEALALLGAFLQGHILAKSHELGITLDSD